MPPKRALDETTMSRAQRNPQFRNDLLRGETPRSKSTTSPASSSAAPNNPESPPNLQTLYLTLKTRAQSFGGL